LSYLESEKVVGKIYFNIYYSFRNKTALMLVAKDLSSNAETKHEMNGSSSLMYGGKVNLYLRFKISLPLVRK